MFSSFFSGGILLFLLAFCGWPRNSVACRQSHCEATVDKSTRQPDEVNCNLEVVIQWVARCHVAKLSEAYVDLSVTSDNTTLMSMMKWTWIYSELAHTRRPCVVEMNSQFSSVHRMCIFAK